jgi:hypothetical protein
MTLLASGNSLWSNPAIWGALVGASATVLVGFLSIPIHYFVDKRALGHQLRSQYEQEQRKQLKDLIASYLGRLVEATDAWHNRMNNLYKYEQEGRVSAERDPYYFRTTVYRFLVLCSLARRFEARAFFVDARIAERSDLDFVKFTKAFRWLMTDFELFEGVPSYDARSGPDHFFTDQLRLICDACCKDDDVISLAEFETRARKKGSFEDVFGFFEGLRSDEARLRWDRIVCLHLLTLSFLNVMGYDIQRSDDAALARVAARIRHPQIRQNFIRGLARFGLADQPEVQRLIKVLDAAANGKTRSHRKLIPTPTRAEAGSLEVARRD